MESSITFARNYYETVIFPEQLTKKVKKCLETEIERALKEETVRCFCNYDSSTVSCCLRLFEDRYEEIEEFYDDFRSVETFHRAQEIHDWLSKFDWKITFPIEESDEHGNPLLVGVELVAETPIESIAPIESIQRLSNL